MAWQQKEVSDVPQSSLDALRTAMAQTGTPESEFNDLAWIMAQESTGHVGIRNPVSTAAGLFQLTHVNYSLMPHGQSSIGNAVEECIGGIRYVHQRYQTAAHAKEFWLQHSYY
jgi:SLT domain-containing protein